MTTCRSCPAEVVFVKSATTGKAMILDAKPAKGVVLTDPTMNMHGLLAFDDDPAHAEARVVDVYTDHHVTCPDAAAWKGRRR